MKSRESIQKLVVTAVLASLIIVLQCFVSIPIGSFTITLTLVPIVVGAVLYGPKTGALLGGVFGAVVTIRVITGLEGAMSTAMLQFSPVVTIGVCLLKGIAAGLVPGALYQLFKNSNKKTIGAVLATMSSPIVNTGLFLTAFLTVFYDIAAQFASATGYPTVMNFVGMAIMLNFLVEFAIQVLLIPLVLQLMRILKITTV